MIKVFSGKWRGIGQSDNGQVYFAQVDFNFREILCHFSGAKLAVFMAIALHGDEKGMSYPSYSLLETETGYSRDTIARALNELCKLEINGQRVLMRYRDTDETGQPTGSNHYLIFPTDAELAQSENLTTDQSETMTTLV